MLSCPSQLEVVVGVFLLGFIKTYKKRIWSYQNLSSPGGSWAKLNVPILVRCAILSEHPV